jgi:glyoxylase-like metal-dependent hydrolase (beta-lactamase superfamily II)
MTFNLNYRSLSYQRAAAFAMAALLSLGAATQMSVAQNQAGDLEVLQVVPNFYVIVGAGGNIGVQIGPDGVVLVNAGAADMSDKVIAAIKKLTPEPIRFIIDTSADPDNVGGNAAVAKAGQSFTQSVNAGPGGAATDMGGANILATDKVLDRMSAPTGKQSAYPVAAWPTDTFFTKERPMYINREGIEVMAQPDAHSDGDLMVFFRRSDVLFTGDIMDTTRFPVIDTEHGGSIQGEIAALNRIVEIAIPSIPLVWEEGGTNVIPGRGRICDQADVVEYRDMITIIRDVVQDMVNRGMTLQQVKEANPTKGYRKRYGSDTGAWTTDMFVEAVYKGLTAKK